MFGYRFCPHVPPSPSASTPADDDNGVDSNAEKLLRAFSSDTCACFPAPMSSPDHVTNHRVRPWCCLCLARPSHPEGEEEKEEEEGSGGVLPHQGPRARSLHSYICRTCKASYLWRRNGRRLYIAFDRCSFLSNSPTSAAWLLSLTPESLGMGGPDGSADQDIWCETRRCVTNKRWMSMVKRRRSLHLPGW